jgi:NAD(P)-dependent dehydrogenase (short-subunit alcohol dehydrogenase family)
MTQLAGRSVVVVGAGGALGSAVAAAARDAGATVVGFDQHVPAAERQLGGVDYRSLDVGEDAAVGAAFEELGAPWAVLNVVGGFAGARPLTDFDPAELATQVQLNLSTAALLTKHALRQLTRAGEGRIVHTASRAALVTPGSSFAYSISKLGVLHLVQMAANELHGTAITVNAVVPSVIDTPANRAAAPGEEHHTWPSPVDIAQVYLFLASPAAKLISGAAIPVYGLT